MRTKSVPYKSPLTTYTRRLSIPGLRTNRRTPDYRSYPGYRLPKDIAVSWRVRSTQDDLYTYVGEYGMLISPDRLPSPKAYKSRIKAQYAAQASWGFALLVGAMDITPKPISFLTWSSGKGIDRLAVVSSPALIAKHLGEFSIGDVPGMTNTDWERIDGFRLRQEDSMPGSEVRLGTAPLQASPADIVYGAFTQLFEGAYASN